MQYITIAERTDPRYHRSHIILHNDLWYLAEFETMEQLKRFSDTLGFQYELSQVRENTPRSGRFEIYHVDHEFSDDHLFARLDDLPDGAKPIQALSNGSIVTCYFHNDGSTIAIYRPNPNSCDLYHPLNLDQQIAHEKQFGVY